MELRKVSAVAALALGLCVPAQAGTPLTPAACTAIATGAGDSCSFVATASSLGYTGYTDTGWSVTHVAGGTTVTDDHGGAGQFNKGAGALRPGITYTFTLQGSGTGAAGTVDPNAASAPPPSGDTSSAIAPYDPCATDSWTAGTVDWCDGRLTYHDYVYDDYGASGGSSPSTSWGSFASQSGTARYAAGEEGTADTIALELWVADGRLHARWLLDALHTAGQTIGALAVDTDDDPATGGGKWGSLNVTSKGWDELHTFADGDPQANTIEGSIPLPPGTRWRVQALTAQKDGTVMNVAFRGPDETGGWYEGDQAAALAAGDVSRFGAEVDVADFTGAATRAAADPGAGRHERVYRSKYTIGPGEGYSYDGIPGRAGG